MIVCLVSKRTLRLGGYEEVFLRFIFSYLYMCVCVCVSVCHKFGGSHRGKKVNLDILEFESQTVVSHQTWVLGINLRSLVLLTIEQSLQLRLCPFHVLPLCLDETLQFVANNK